MKQPDNTIWLFQVPDKARYLITQMQESFTFNIAIKQSGLLLTIASYNSFWWYGKMFHQSTFFSSGYLKKHHSTLFCPPLPAHKLHSVQKLGFGTCNKIYVEFESPWWDADCDIIHLVWEDEVCIAAMNHTVPLQACTEPLCKCYKAWQNTCLCSVMFAPWRHA